MLGFLALAAVLLVAFVLIERRSVEPLVRLSIFSVKTVRGANVAMFIVAAGLFSMFFFNTLYVQRVLGFSPLEAGALAALACIMGFFGGLVASAIKRDRGVKDWGHMIEGHGGMLDRADSLVFAAPVFFHIVRYAWT